MSTNKSTTNPAIPSPLFSRGSTTGFMWDIIHEVLTSDEWEAFALNNPKIQESESSFYKEIDKLPRQTILDIEDVHTAVVTAYMDAAFLFGMHFMESIRGAAADPLTLYQGLTGDIKVQKMGA